jgi:hypothetical protein
MELKIVLKKFSDKFVQRRGFTTQQQQQQPQTSNVAQSSSKTTETPSPTTTTTTASNQNQTQTQAHSTSHTTSKTQTPTQPQSESLQSSNESKISPPNVTKRQVRQALLKGNRFTRLVSVGVVVSFAATTGYYLYGPYYFGFAFCCKIFLFSSYLILCYCCHFRLAQYECNTLQTTSYNVTS